MKNTISKSNNTVNCEIDIRLDDECKNGHEDFSITGTFWEIDKPRIDRYCIMAGCCHDEILQHFPDLEIFVRLHLCDFSGAPMYAVSNGFYHVKNGMSKEEFQDYFNCSPYAADVLFTAENEEHFHFLVQKLGLPARWQVTANIAILKLEKMIGTGEKFETKHTRRHFTPLPEERMRWYEKKTASGYFDPAKIAAREEARKKASLKKHISGIREKCQKDIEKEKREAGIKILVAQVTKSECTNFIYYNHNNTVKFNWLERTSYRDSFTVEQIEIAKDALQKIENPPTVI